MTVNHNPATPPQEVINMADIKTDAPVVGVETFSKEDVLKAISEVKAEFSTALGEKDKVITELQQANKQVAVNAQIAEFKRSGKIIPAFEAEAKAILMNGSQAVTFGETNTDVAGLFVKVLNALPTLVKFGEVGETSETTEVEFSADQIAVWAKLGVTPEEVREVMGGK
jgi:hypothetical protein